MKPRVGISSCLLGQAVRYDGRDKRDAFLVDALGRHVEWVAVCPELEVGMGVPREPVRLVLEDRVRLRGVATGRDWTDALSAFAAARVRGLPADLAGYVLKARSPSCGLGTAPVERASAEPATPALGSGLFAAALTAARPLLPCEDEVGLADAARRERFLERVFALGRLAALLAGSAEAGGAPGRAGVAEAAARRCAAFHARHRLQLLARGAAELEALTGDPAAYAAAFRETVAREATLAGAARALALALAAGGVAGPARRDAEAALAGLAAGALSQEAARSRVRRALAGGAADLPSVLEPYPAELSPAADG